MPSLMLALLMGGAQVELPKVEEFWQDLTAEEVEVAAVQRDRGLAQEAYIWGLPAFLHYRQATEIKHNRKLIAPNEEPFGGWVLLRNLATPETDNALPNVDTLYGASYLHLGKQGPVVLRLPAIRDRYYSVTMLDAYFNNFEVVGTRNTGPRAAAYLIVPPGWTGAAPAGIDKVIHAPTPMIALFQRIYVNDEQDIAKVRPLQDGITVSPMAGGAFPRIETPEFDTTTAVRNTRDPMRYFEIVNSYTAWNPPTPAYSATMASIAAAGLGPRATLPTDPKRREAIALGAKDAQATINADITKGPFRNGWRVPDPRGGHPGPFALAQAVLQISQIGSLPMDEAVYFVGRRDADGALLDGKGDYDLTFLAGQLPPVSPQGFWSVTMYKASDNFLVANPINRYVIRPSTPGIKANRDGSLTIRIAAQRPKGVPDGNWLPAPAEGFVLAIRAYLPEKPILDGAWFPPAPVKRTPRGR